jgi:hypothetical protein
MIMLMMIIYNIVAEKITAYFNVLPHRLPERSKGNNKTH